MVCAILPSDAAFASGVVAYADCQARNLGQAGYLALAAPGGTIPLLLTVLVTIAVALLGYRLILTDLPQPREIVVMLVKLGIVLAFATGWAAYRPVIYDVAMNSPSELAGTIGGAAGLVSGQSLPLHLDAVDGQIQQLAIENMDRPARISSSGPVAPPLFANSDNFMLGGARVVFLVSALVSYAGPRLLAGVLLALGPLFIAFLLFDATRGLAEAWLTALVGAAMATLAAMVMLGVEIGLLEPWLKVLIARRVADQAMPAASIQLMVVVLVFAITLAFVWLATARAVGRGRVSLAKRAVTRPNRVADVSPGMASREGSAVMTSTNAIAQRDRSRASAIADVAVALHRRENTSEQLGQAGVSSGSTAGTRPPTAGREPSLSSRDTNLRRTAIRRSGSAQRRDREA